MRLPASGEFDLGGVVGLVERQRMPIARVGSRNDVHQHCAVEHGAAHRSDMRQRAERRQRISGNAAETRLQPEEAAKARRNADRTAAIGAEAQRAKARCDRGPGSARRTARRLRLVPRIARRAGQQAVGRTLPAEFGSRGLSDQDGARFFQPGDARRIRVPILVLIDRARAAQRRPTFGQEQVLDRDGYAIQRRQGLARQPARLGRFGHRARGIAIHKTEGIDLGVQRFDPGETTFRDFERRKITRLKLRRQFGRGHFMRFVGHVLPRKLSPPQMSRPTGVWAAELTLRQLHQEKSGSKAPRNRKRLQLGGPHSGGP